MKRNENGFTIIELLVAMAILGLLIGLMIPGIAIVQRGARNTARKTSIQAIQAALEETYGHTRVYPASVDTSLVDTQFTTVNTCAIDGVVTDKETFSYYYVTTNNDYSLGACLEGGYFEAK